MSSSQRYADRYGRVLASQRVMAADRKGALASIVGAGIVGVLTLALAICSFVMLSEGASAAGFGAVAGDPASSALLMAGAVIGCATLVLFRLHRQRQARSALRVAARRRP